MARAKRKLKWSDLDADQRRMVWMAVIVDGVAIGAGFLLYFVTQQWIWILAGAIFGAGVLLPVMLKLAKMQRDQSPPGDGT